MDQVVELAAIDNNRYIVYSEEDVTMFDHDNVMVIDLNTLTKNHPESDEFKLAMDRIKNCLPNMIVRIADPGDVELYEELQKYFFNPTQVHGFDVKKFLGDIFDYTSNESLKNSYENLDSREVKQLNDFFDSNLEDVNKLNKLLKDMDSPALERLFDEMDMAPEDLTAKKVYELDIIDMVEKNSPMKDVITKTFDLARDEDMRKEMDPLMRKLMGDVYKDVVYVEDKENLYVFTDPKLKRVNKAPWWPNSYLEKEEWEQLYNRDQDFKMLVDEKGYKPDNARLWEVPINTLLEEEEMVKIIEDNQGKLRGHQMKEGMEPWFEDELGQDYLDIFVEPGSKTNRKAYVFVEPDAKVNIDNDWWPKKPITISEYTSLMEQYEGFRNIDEELYGAAEG